MGSNFEVRFSDGGKKSLKKVSRQDAVIVLRKLPELRQFSGTTKNVKRLRGTRQRLFRLRVGDLRVIFEVEISKKLVWILFVGYRGGVYRNWK